MASASSAPAMPTCSEVALLQPVAGQLQALFRIAADAVQQHRLAQDLRHGEARVERGVRVLEHDLDAALVVAQPPRRQRQHVLALEQHPSGAGLLQPHQRQPQRALAAAGFADDAQRASAHQGERHPVHRALAVVAEPAVAAVVVDAEPLHLQDHAVVRLVAALALRRLEVAAVAEEVPDHRQLGRAACQVRAAAQQRLGVGVLWRLEDLPHRRVFVDAAVVHHHHFVGELADQLQVVADEQHRHAVLLLQAGQELQDLLLDGDVQRGGRLVGDQQLRLAGDGHRDHHPLLLAAGQLVRVAAHLALRRRQADFLQQRQRALLRRLAANPGVQHQRFDDLFADAEHRVERAHRLLEHHGDVAAAQAAQLAAAGGEQVAAAEQDLAVGVDVAAVLRQQPGDRHRGHRLAGAGFADQRHGLAGRDVEADAFHRFGAVAVFVAEADAQPAHAEQGRSGVHDVTFGTCFTLGACFTERFHFRGYFTL